MTNRFKVIRQHVKFKGKLYCVGDVLPENFTEREKFRCTFPSRVAVLTPEELEQFLKAENGKSKGAESITQAPIRQSGEIPVATAVQNPGVAKPTPPQPGTLKAQAPSSVALSGSK